MNLQEAAGFLHRWEQIRISRCNQALSLNGQNSKIKHKYHFYSETYSLLCSNYALNLARKDRCLFLVCVTMSDARGFPTATAIFMAIYRCRQLCIIWDATLCLRRAGT